MSGEKVLLQDDGSGRVVAYVRTLGRLPVEPAWVLVGGLAVNIRLGRLHRATNDVDTVCGDQPGLVEILVAADAEKLSAAKVLFHDPDVEIDVMESTEGASLPLGESDRAFALARRWTMHNACAVTLGAVDATGLVVANAEFDVASRPALLALKAISIPRRAAGSYPQKIGSDIQDLFRLLQGQDLDTLVAEFASLDHEARRWVAESLVRGFSSGTSSLGYAFARLRRLADNADARSIDEDDLALIGEFGAALLSAI